MTELTYTDPLHRFEDIFILKTNKKKLLHERNKEYYITSIKAYLNYL